MLNVWCIGCKDIEVFGLGKGTADKCGIAFVSDPASF